MLSSTFKIFVFIGSLVFSLILSADSSNTSTISISIVVPESLENQHCKIGFRTSHNKNYQSLQATSCKYNAYKLKKIASLLAAQQDTSLNNQGFVTIVVTTP